MGEKGDLVIIFMDSKIKTYLDRLASSPKRPSSFLFFGPDEEEKSKAAFYFVQKISGKAGDGEFLRRAEGGIHPDIVIVEPEIEEKKGRVREKEISILQVREALGKLRFFPYELKAKFCLIKKCQRLGVAASNALLKFIEEPADNAFVIFLADQQDSVLPTIVSRCAVLRFPAERDLPVSPENRERLRELFREGIAAKLDYAQKISKDRSEAVRILKMWETAVAESLRTLVRKGDLENTAKVTRLLGNMRGTINVIEYTNADARIALESLLLNI